MKISLAAIGSIVVITFVAATVHAAGITVAPFSFAPRGLGEFVPGGGPPALARWEKVSGDWQLFLAKNVPTAEIAAAGAQINGVSGLSTTGLTIGFTVESGWCGAGAPRFNVRLANAGLVFLGCAHADLSGTFHSFTDGGIYGGVLFPTGDVVQSISIVFDEGTDVGPGFVYLDDITVGSDVAGAPGRSDQ